MDLDTFFTFWAVEVLIFHVDGYAGNSNNYYLYADPADSRFQFIPWGIDNILNDPTVSDEYDLPASVMASGFLTRRLYLHPIGRERYVETLLGLLDTVWDETGILSEIDRMEALITPVADPDGSKGLDDEIEHVRDFVRNRDGVIRAEFSVGPPVWTEPLRGSPCFDPIGSVTVTFGTHWGSIDGEDPFEVGGGTMVGDVDGTPFNPIAVGAVAGFDTAPDSAGGPIFSTYGYRSDETLIVVIVAVYDPVSIVAGETVGIDLMNAIGYVIHYDIATETDEIIGMLMGGTIAFEEAGTTDGASIRATIDSPIVAWGI